jgi:hypothetical protein
MSAELAEPATDTRGRYLDAEPATFRTSFDEKPFAFRHRFSSHPLFELPRLFELLRSLSEQPGEVYFDAGDVGVGERWDQIPLPRMTVEDALQRIESSGAWIIIRHSEKDPAYAEVLDQCMEEAEALAGRRFRQEMRVQHAIIFITSPGRVTPFHIDRECNFILQIHGAKTLNVFDRNDRDVLPDEELERFWSHDSNAAIYKPQYQSRANVYALAPGDAVHVPVNCPHWVKNGENVSVTLSVNFWYRNIPRADVYRANYFLRRMGMSPRPPGSSFRDAAKRKVLPGFDGLREAHQRFLKRKTGP